RRANDAHPILRGVEDIVVRDEFYFQLKRVEAARDIEPLLLARIDGQDEMVSWCWERPEGGRSFGFSGLHFHDNWGLETYRRFATQGIVWTLGLPIAEAGLPVTIDAEVLSLDEARRSE